MVWSPAVGYDYPNIGGAPKLPDGVLPALDTSANGQVGPEDDPYGPYYPGDQFVDWVGISSNWLPVQEPPKARNGPPPNGYFVGCVNGNPEFLVNMNSEGTTNNLNFYARFAETLNKPMILR
jgi:hypothetical protein